MRIGITGGGASPDQVIRQVERAEADGFTSIWFPGAAGGDPLVAMALAGRATTSIEMGTAVLQTYACHPMLQAQRFLAAAKALADPRRLTLGIGPSHQPVVEDVLGLRYDTPGRHTEEYVTVLTALLRGEAVRHEGAELRVAAGPITSSEDPEPEVLVAALGPRLLRVAGEQARGTILWMGNARAIETHVAPRIRAAATAAGRPEPRIVAGLPVAVHDDVDEARAAAASQFAVYGTLPNYQRLLAHGGASGPAEAAIVGDEASVRAQIEALFAAGATDVWAAPFPVGEDRSASRARTRALLVELAAA